MPEADKALALLSAPKTGLPAGTYAFERVGVAPNGLLLGAKGDTAGAGVACAPVATGCNALPVAGEAKAFGAVGSPGDVLRAGGVSIGPGAVAAADADITAPAAWLGLEGASNGCGVLRRAGTSGGGVGRALPARALPTVAWAARAASASRTTAA